MTKAYDPSLTMRAARDRYFEDNGFGPDGGYASPWVDFKLGPIPMPFPNTAGRVRAVRFHDLHHLVTGYATDTLGEFEIGAWELGAGCKDFWVAWQLNFGSVAAGALVIPRRTFRAFVRGRRTHTLYGRDLDALLDRTVGAISAELGTDCAAEPTLADLALFIVTALVGSVIGLVTFGLLVVVGGPLLFLGTRLRRAAREAHAAGA
ncbi:hypothetical protein A7982_12184 [Minicystis rosea]|nr:hypothetical protein A7982_12184 [Minicystis rosea]